MQRLTKNEREFCGEMETGMEKTMEQIENILERATLDQLKIILRFLRNIIKSAPERETVPAGCAFISGLQMDERIHCHCTQLDIHRYFMDES